MNLAALFDITGYLRVPNVLQDEQVERMRSRIRADFQARVPPFRVNSRGEVARLDRMFERDSVFSEALRSESLRPALTAVLGPTAEIVLTRHNHATMNLPGDIPFRLHRDIQQWSQPLVSVFFFLEDSRVQNGCTTIVPGTHRLPYAGAQSGDGGGNWADEHVEYLGMIGQELPIEVRRGGALLINSLAFHSVGRNESGKARMSCVFALRAADELVRDRDSRELRTVYGTPRNLSNDRLANSGSLARGG